MAPGFKKNRIVSSRDQYYIIELVSTCTGISIARLKSIHRYRDIVEARQIAMYLIKKYTTLTIEKIGALFGGRDHSTTIYSINTANDLLHSNENFKNKLLDIETKLTN